MADLTLRPLPLPEFHLLLRSPTADGAHKTAANTPASARPSDFYLESFSDAVSAFGSSIPPTRFQFYFISFVLKANATSTTGLASFRTRPRMAFFVPPEQIHSSRGWKANDAGYALSFSEAFFVENLADKSALRRSPLFQWDRVPYLQLSAGEDRSIQALYQQLEEEWRLKPNHSPGILRLLLQLIVARFEEFALRGNPSDAPLDAGARLYQRFRALLEQRFRLEKSPAAYAENLGVHPNHLATAIRSASGLPPGDWIRARVILEAQCLLANTDRSVKEVAGELGYDDEAYFSRLFKKSVGVSPRSYQLGEAA